MTGRPPGELHDEVLELLKAGPLSRQDIARRSKHAEDVKQVAKVLHRLREKGRVEKSAEGLWSLASRPARTDAASILRRPLAAADAKAPVEKLLAQAAQDAQRALDEYVASVADPTILEPLRTSRDATRAALARFQARRGMQ